MSSDSMPVCTSSSELQSTRRQHRTNALRTERRSQQHHRILFLLCTIFLLLLIAHVSGVPTSKLGGAKGTPKSTLTKSSSPSTPAIDSPAAISPPQSSTPSSPSRRPTSPQRLIPPSNKNIPLPSSSPSDDSRASSSVTTTSDLSPSTNKNSRSRKIDSRRDIIARRSSIQLDKEGGGGEGSESEKKKLDTSEAKSSTIPTPAKGTVAPQPTASTPSPSPSGHQPFRPVVPAAPTPTAVVSTPVPNLTPTTSQPKDVSTDKLTKTPRAIIKGGQLKDTVTPADVTIKPSTTLPTQEQIADIESNRAKVMASRQKLKDKSAQDAQLSVPAKPDTKVANVTPLITNATIAATPAVATTTTAATVSTPAAASTPISTPNSKPPPTTSTPLPSPSPPAAASNENLATPKRSPIDATHDAPPSDSQIPGAIRSSPQKPDIPSTSWISSVWMPFHGALVFIIIFTLSCIRRIIGVCRRTSSSASENHGVKYILNQLSAFVYDKKLLGLVDSPMSTEHTRSLAMMPFEDGKSRRRGVKAGQSTKSEPKNDSNSLANDIEMQSLTASLSSLHIPKMVYLPSPNDDVTPGGVSPYASTCLLTPHRLQQLLPYLPATSRIQDLALKYSLGVCGASINELYRRCQMMDDAITVIQDSAGYIFGCYTSAPWSIHNSYYGNGESFVFTLHPQFHIYPSTSANQFFQLASRDSLAIGGGDHFAIWLDESFAKGSSKSCQTFASPSLSGEEDFRVNDLEVWCSIDEQW